jgi:hypothetical protein
MKKIIFAFAFLFIGSFFLASCTNEEVKPKSSGEGHVIDKGF